MVYLSVEILYREYMKVNPLHDNYFMPSRAFIYSIWGIMYNSNIIVNGLPNSLI